MEVSTLNGYKIKDKKATRFYNTIADMKADTTLKVGMHIKTSGYYNANDGGHAEYKIIDDNTLIEDHGNLHLLNNGLFAKLIIENNIVNIKQFGAKGDGITDDFTAIQNALNLGVPVLIPYTSQFYGIHPNENLIATNSIKFESFVKCLSTPTGARYSAIFYFDKCNTGKKIIIDNPLIDGNWINENVQEYQAGIYLGGCSNITINNGIIQNMAGDGITVSHSADRQSLYSQNININNVNIDNIFRNGISIISCENIYINSCIINKLNSYVAGIDFEPNPDSTLHLKNCNVSNCKIWTDECPGILMAIPNAFEKPDIINIDNCEIHCNSLGINSTVTDHQFENVNVTNTRFFDNGKSMSQIMILQGKNISVNNITCISKFKNIGFIGFEYFENKTERITEDIILSNIYFKNTDKTIGGAQSLSVHGKNVTIKDSYFDALNSISGISGIVNIHGTKMFLDNNKLLNCRNGFALKNYQWGSNNIELLCLSNSIFTNDPTASSSRYAIEIDSDVDNIISNNNLFGEPISPHYIANSHTIPYIPFGFTKKVYGVTGSAPTNNNFQLGSVLLNWSPSNALGYFYNGSAWKKFGAPID